MATYKIELKKILDEYIEDIISALEDDIDFNDIENLQEYIEKNLDMSRDGCVFLDLHFEIPTPYELEEKQ